MLLEAFHPVLIKMIQAEYGCNVYHQKHHKCIQQSVSIYCFISCSLPQEFSKVLVGVKLLSGVVLHTVSHNQFDT